MKIFQKHGSMEMYPGYDDDLLVYYQYSTQLESSKDWLKNVLDHSPRTIVKEGTGDLSILSVGSGAGDPDGLILDYILSNGRPVHHTSVEPSAVQMTRFRSNIACNPKYVDVKFNMLQMKSKEFLESDHAKQTFDLIIFFHSLYFVGSDLASTLRKYHGITAPGGSIVALTCSRGTGWDSVSNHLAGQVPLSEINTAEHVEAALKENGIHYDKQEISYTLDIVCLNAAPMLADDDVGNSLLNFIMFAHDARRNLPRPLVNKAIEYLKSLASEDDEKLLVTNLTVVHLIIAV